MPAIRKVEVEIGDRFSKLVATSSLYYREEGKGQRRLVCDFECDCGKTKTIRATHVTTGKINSCGCLRVNKLGEGESSFNSLFWEYKYHAERRGLVFELSREDFRKITKSNCEYCGIEPRQECTRNWRKSKSTPYVYNGVDRVRNEQGYTLENCVPCCKTCNVAKHALTLEQFMQWIARLVKFHS